MNILKFAKKLSRNFKLNNLKVVLDCANGAGYKSAPKLIRSLGAKIKSYR